MCGENFELNDFKLNVKNYLIIDDDIKKLEKHSKELKQAKSKLNNEILKFMNNHNIEDLNTDTGKLKKNIRYLKKPLNKKILKSKLNEYCKNDLETETLFKFIENRDKEEKVELKRIINKEK